jgi:hypothetical protein
MKLTDNDRSELLEALFPLENEAAVHADDILRWIEKERRVRQRRLRYASIAIVVLLLTASAVTFLPRNQTAGTFASKTSVVSPEEIPPTPSETARPVVEQVDDETLMRLLDDTPAALVEWPDGRKSLYVVVQQQQQP